MLKLELIHVFRKLADGGTDYISQMVEFDYSHLGEEHRDVVTTEYGSRTYVTFARGLVVGYESHYIGDGDSVGSIIVWDPIEKKPVGFGTGYENMERNRNENIDFDATPEVKAEYAAYQAEIARKVAETRKEEEIAKRKWEEAKEAATPRKGRRIRVVKGRKVAKGTVGYSFWYGETQWGFSVGILKDDGTKVFTSASNVEVIKDNLVYLEKKYAESLGGTK